MLQIVIRALDSHITHGREGDTFKFARACLKVSLSLPGFTNPLADLLGASDLHSLTKRINAGGFQSPGGSFTGIIHACAVNLLL